MFHRLCQFASGFCLMATHDNKCLLVFIGKFFAKFLNDESVCWCFTLTCIEAKKTSVFFSKMAHCFPCDVGLVRARGKSFRLTYLNKIRIGASMNTVPCVRTAGF